MDMNTKLLWITGPMQGRELRLPQGELSMGPCGDVMVPLSERESIQISVTEEGVFIRDSIPVWCNGVAANTQEPLPFGQAIEVSGVGFILGSLDQSLVWQRLPEHVKAKASGGRRLFLSFITLMTVVLMSFVVMLPKNIEPTFNPHMWLQSQLNVPSLNQVKASWNEDGVVSLSGYCDNSLVMSKLKEGLKLHGIRFNTSAVCTDELISNVEAVLSANGYQDVHVSPSRIMGEVRISGAIQSGQQWEKVSRELDQIHGLKHWQVTNDIGGFVQKLISALRDKGLLDGLMIERRQDSIVVTGQIRDLVRSQIRQVTKQLLSNTGQNVDLRFENIPLRDSISRYLSGEIMSFGGNQSHPFVELSSGKRLTLNSKLDNGYMVTHIDFKGLDLTRDGQLIHIPFIL